MTSWTNFIERAPTAEHAVHVYDDVSKLARSVAAFLAAGFHAGDPALVIKTSEHWTAFAGELEERGWDAGALGGSDRIDGPR